MELTFHFLGAIANGRAQYGAGAIEASIDARIFGARTSDPFLPLFQLFPQDAIWGISRSVKLANATSNGSNLFTLSGSTIDARNVGVPTEVFQSGYGSESFFSAGALTVDAFTATIGFGVLQPGEFFALAYDSDARAFGESVTYTGEAFARVIDPFSLAAPPPFQISLAGLQLPTAPVPAPTSAWLLLSGLGFLGWRGRHGIRRPSAERLA